MNINKIIKEEVNRYLMTEIFGESDDNSQEHDHHEHHDGEEHHESHNDSRIEMMKAQSDKYHEHDSNEEDYAQKIVQDKGVNNYEIFRNMDKEGTSFEGYDLKSGARYMEKKAKHEESPSGDSYKLTGNDASAIVNAYRQMLPK